MYMRGEPLYPFGFGLGFTTFKYSNLRADRNELSAGGQVAMSVDITNTGSRDGEEVVQFYVRHLGSTVSRPNRELKAFRRIIVPKGQTRTVTVPLKAESLAYWDEKQNRFVVEAEQVEVAAGGSSADAKLKTTVTVANAQ